MSWMFNSTMDTFHFVVKVRATGWIGFGLATQAPNGMMGYDVAVSGANNGTNNGTNNGANNGTKYLTVGDLKNITKKTCFFRYHKR